MWEYHQVPASTWITGDTHRPLGEAPPAKVLKRNEAYDPGPPPTAPNLSPLFCLDTPHSPQQLINRYSGFDVFGVILKDRGISDAKFRRTFTRLDLAGCHADRL